MLRCFGWLIDSLQIVVQSLDDSTQRRGSVGLSEHTKYQISSLW